MTTAPLIDPARAKRLDATFGADRWSFDFSVTGAATAGSLVDGELRAGGLSHRSTTSAAEGVGGDIASLIMLAASDTFVRTADAALGGPVAAAEGVLAYPYAALDPVTLRVLGGAFNAIAGQMAHVLYRMSYSSIVRES